MALAEALTTVALVKTHLGITSSTEDTRIDQAVDHASRLILDHLDRTIYPTVAKSEDLDGTGTDKLFASHFPILTSPAPTLRVDSERLFGSDTIQVLGTDWTIDYDTGIVRIYSSTFPRGVGNCRLGYTCGYAAIPPSLQLICTEFAAFLYKSRGSRGHSQVSSGGLFVGSDMRGIPKAFAEQLAPWVRQDHDDPLYFEIEG